MRKGMDFAGVLILVTGINNMISIYKILLFIFYYLFITVIKIKITI